MFRAVLCCAVLCGAVQFQLAALWGIKGEAAAGGWVAWAVFLLSDFAAHNCTQGRTVAWVPRSWDWIRLCCGGASSQLGSCVPVSA